MILLGQTAHFRSVLRNFLVAGLVVIASGAVFTRDVFAVGVPPLTELSSELALSHPELVTQRATLMSERAVLRARTATHNKNCDAVAEGSEADMRCTLELDALSADAAQHVQESLRFNESLLEGRVLKFIKKMKEFAKRLGWSAEEQARLNIALNSLELGGDIPSDGQIKAVWDNMKLRSQSDDFAREAAMTGGIGLPGAGLQAYQDCAVFALASVTGRPYGFVAAQAAELISQGEWRSAADRANPQRAIEEGGLNGGEVVILAEAFGQAEVVGSADFARTLKNGRPVLVNVVPKGGGGHEVLLTKTFQHNGETWYELLDSNQGPQKRLYLSGVELSTIMQENGVVFRPNPGTTPKLLRSEKGQ